MPITTDLSVSPYFDDHDPLKDYYRVLFKPGVSVQVRELNELQTLMAQQVERFGDNIFQKGTIVEGCGFVFNDSQPYVKILDSEVSGETAIPSLYQGMFLRNSANLSAFVVNYADGYEASQVDLKTLYVNYISGGASGEVESFTTGDVLTIYDPEEGIYSVGVTDGGIGFSNNDEVIVTSKVSVNVTSGTFRVGDYIVDADVGGVANLEVTAVDSVTLRRDGHVLLTVRPRVEDLISATANSTLWTLSSAASVKNRSNTAAGVVQSVFGAGATGRVVTNGSGVVQGISVLTRGSEYTYPPVVTIKSLDNQNGVEQLSLDARNYVGQVTVALGADSVGNGYIFGVGEGVIYQQGHFLRVSPQSVIVSKYDTAPNAVAVGFRTEEDIVDSNVDPELLDNALGTENYTAPGADRLRMRPYLNVLSKDAADSDPDFFTLVEWNEGDPYKQNQVTSYSRIGDEMARQNFDMTGNFVIDPFNIVTESIANSEMEGTHYGIVIDPGHAYINGKKVRTSSSYKLSLPKGTDTLTSNVTTSLTYGNYVRVNQLGGNWPFKTGASVQLRSLPKQFLSNSAAYATGNVEASGTFLGWAKMRSLVREEGDPGLPSTTYRMYLFDIAMSNGRSFREARSVHYGTAPKATADIVLDVDPTTGTNAAVLKETSRDSLLFASGVSSVKNTNNAVYVYRTTTNSAVVTSSGTLTIDLTSNVGEYHDKSISGSLTAIEMDNLIVVPTEADLIPTANLSGNVQLTTGNLTVIGVGTDSFFSTLKAGDYVMTHPTAGTTDTRRVTRLINTTAFEIDVAPSASNTSPGAKFKRMFPKNVPVPFGRREGLTANVDPNRKVLILDFNQSNGDSFTFTTDITTTVAYNVRREGVSSSLKTANRQKFIKIQANTSVANTRGPWSVGVPDVFRLRNVYVASTTSVNTASPNVTEYFYIDHNQKAGSIGLSYLYIDPASKFRIGNNDVMLVEFDYFTRETEGYYDAVSYRRTAEAADIALTDALPLEDLTAAAHSLEIPEVYTKDNRYFDLHNTIDFRPAVAATVTPVSLASIASAPVNPSATENFNALDKKFPYPGGSMTYDVEQYLGRIDDVFVSDQGGVFVQTGISARYPKARHTTTTPRGAMKIQTISVPPYPSVAQINSDVVNTILGRKIANEKKINIRLVRHTTKFLMSDDEVAKSQPIGYSMEDIGNLERRIKDLEYYMSLSLLETSVANRVIPSSVNPALNRFKFGFFADDFSTATYTDLENPQHMAAFESEGKPELGTFSAFSQDVTLSSASQTNPINDAPPVEGPTEQKATNRIVPAKHHYSLDHADIGIDNAPYMDHFAIGQLNATVEPPNVINPCVPVINISSQSYYDGNGYVTVHEVNPLDPREVVVSQVTFGNVSAPATIYFSNYYGPDMIQVYQSNGVAWSLVAGTQQLTSPTLLNLTETDKTFLRNSVEAKEFHNVRLAQDTYNIAWVRDTVDPNYVRNSGKIVWNHNPASGLDYFIRVTKRGGSVLWKYLLEFPTSESTTVKTITPVTSCAAGNPQPAIYTGTMKVRRLKTGWSNQLVRVGGGGYYAAYEVSVTGLKGSTRVRFYINGVEYNTTSQFYKAQDIEDEKIFIDSTEEIGNALYSNIRGQLSFTVFLKPDGRLITGGISQASGITNSWGASGFTTLEVSAPNSSAKLIVKDRPPLIASDGSQRLFLV